MPKPWPISRLFTTTLLTFVVVICLILSVLAAFILWHSRDLQTRTEKALFEGIRAELQASYSRLYTLLEQRKKEFRASHETALEQVGDSVDNIDPEALKRILERETGVTVDVYLISPERRVVRTTYPADQNLDFNHPALLDGKTMIERAHSKNTIITSPPVLEAMTRDFRIYTYSPVGDTEYTLEFGFVPPSLNRHFREIEERISRRELFDARLHFLMWDNWLLSLHPERPSSLSKAAFLEEQFTRKQNVIASFREARDSDRPVPVTGKEKPTYLLHLMDIPTDTAWDMNVLAEVRIHSEAIASQQRGLLIAVGVTIVLLLISVLLIFLLVRQTLAQPLSNAASAMQHWQPMTLSGPARWVRELQLLASHYNSLLEGTRTRIQGLDQEVRTDSLTQLANRFRLETELETEIRRCERYHTVFSLIFMDIDHFKNINDAYGHLTGDHMLRQFSQILQQRTRETDTVGRWGGEEFVMICRDTNLEDTLTLAESLRHKIETTMLCSADPCTASFGVATYHPGDSMEWMISRADEALYRAKRTGRNQVMAEQ